MRVLALEKGMLKEHQLRNTASGNNNKSQAKEAFN